MRRNHLRSYEVFARHVGDDVTRCSSRSPRTQRKLYRRTLTGGKASKPPGSVPVILLGRLDAEVRVGVMGNRQDFRQDFALNARPVRLVSQNRQISADLGKVAAWSNGKTTVFGTGIRRFESCRPSQFSCKLLIWKNFHGCSGDVVLSCSNAVDGPLRWARLPTRSEESRREAIAIGYEAKTWIVWEVQAALDVSIRLPSGFCGRPAPALVMVKF